MTFYSYTVTGTLMDKETGKPVQSGGKDVTSTVAFTPEKPAGSVKVSFKVDATEMAGKTLVVFETLRLDGEEVASHADIDSAEQSVTVANPPAKTPPAPEPEAPPTGPLPQTGDGLPWVPIACFAAAAACLMLVALLARRRGIAGERDACGPEEEGDGDDDEEDGIVWQDVIWE